MLYWINPKPPRAGTGGPIWSLLAPLSLAARNDQPLDQPVIHIVRSLGFESFTYAMSTEKTVHAETRFYYTGASRYLSSPSQCFTQPLRGSISWRAERDAVWPTNPALTPESMRPRFFPSPLQT